MGAKLCGYIWLGGRALWLVLTWIVAAWEIAHLGNCHLGKYPWKVAAWEKAFGKIPNLGKSTLQ